MTTTHARPAPRMMDEPTTMRGPIRRIPSVQRLASALALIGLTCCTSGPLAAGLKRLGDVEASSVWSGWCDEPRPWFGSSVTLGDFNGDSYDDLAVASDLGVWVHYADPSRRNIFDQGVEVLRSGSYDPTDVLAANVNGDGFDDLLISMGRSVYVYHGGATGIQSPADWVYNRPAGEARPQYLAALDANGSGISGFILSLDDSLRAEGFYGSPSGLPGDLSPDFLVKGSGEPGIGMGVYRGVHYWLAGYSTNSDVSRAGVILNGGTLYDQYAAGFPNTDIDWDQDGDLDDPGDSGYNYGAVLIGPRYQILSGDRVSNTRFGYSLGDAGDVNGDGWTDFLASARQDHLGIYAGSATAGSKVFLYLGLETGFARMNPDYVWSVDVPIDTGAADGNSTSYFGAQVGSAGDINGDGFGDILIADHRYDNRGGREQSEVGWWGRCYIWYGGAPSPTNPSGLTPAAGPQNANLILPGEGENGSFGSAFAAGDINGDGFGDLVIGDPRALGSCWNDDGGGEWVSDVGRVQVYVSDSGPDLRISLSTASTEVDVGESVEFTARATNTGLAPAGACTLEFRFGSTRIPYSVPALAPGGVSVAQHQWVFTEEGRTYVSGFVDSEEQVNEYDEANNSSGLYLDVGLATDPGLSASPSALSQSCLEGEDAPDQSFEVWNSGSGSMNYTVNDDADWLECTPASGSSSGEHDTITVDYLPAGLAPGTHQATISVTAPGVSGSPATIGVTLVVEPAAKLAVSPTTLQASCLVGEDPPAGEFRVWNSGSQSMSYTVTDNADWLDCTPSGGDCADGYDSISVIYATSSMASGIHHATITVSAPDAGGSPQEIAVTLTVSEETPELSVSPLVLVATAEEKNDAAPGSFEIRNNGGGTLLFEIIEHVGWLECTPTSGSIGAGEHVSVGVQFSSATLSNGSYPATIEVRAPGAADAPQTVNVTLAIAAGFTEIRASLSQPDLLSLSWSGGPGILLEKSVRLDGSDWSTVAGSEGVGQIDIPIAEPVGFFRATTSPPANRITVQPVGTAAAQGTPVGFEVVASGSISPTYQWRLDGGDIPGANGAGYSIGAVQPTDVGDYTVAVTFGTEVLVSEPATLVILPPGGALCRIPAGTFIMGSPPSEPDRGPDEGPLTTVTLSRGFWIGTRAVTQTEYVALTGSNPSVFTADPQHPVEFLTWDEATAYCTSLTQRERSAGRIPADHAYRLPYEAEWEYACRVGTTTRFSHGDDPGYTWLTTYAWVEENSGNTTHPVGQKQPNPWGLRDTHGNVWEFCQDWLSESLPGGTATDPTGPPTGSHRVVRGGSYFFGGAHARSANRAGLEQTGSRWDTGFRVVLSSVP